MGCGVYELAGLRIAGGFAGGSVTNIREVIAGYIEVLKEDGLPVPEEKFGALIVAV